MVNDENHTASSGTPPVADLAEPVVPSSVESQCKRFFVVFGCDVFWAVVLGCLACLCGLYDAATSATGIASLLILAATTVSLIVLFWHYQRSAALVNYELGASAVWIGYFLGSVSLSSFIDGEWFGLIFLLWIVSASIGGPIVASQHERTPHSALARTVRAFALIVLMVTAGLLACGPCRWCPFSRGSTICYAYMQAVGMVNDHVVGCFRHRELARTRRGKKDR